MLTPSIARQPRPCRGTTREGTSGAVDGGAIRAPHGPHCGSGGLTNAEDVAVTMDDVVRALAYHYVLFEDRKDRPKRLGRTQIATIVRDLYE